jgi:hypothetical protein
MKTIGISRNGKILYILLSISIIINITNSYGQVASDKDTINKAKVFYIGLNNPVKISVPGVKMDIMEVTIDQGTIFGDSGNYIVRPVKSGNATITVKNKGKIITSLNYAVKRIPDPMPAVKNHSFQHEFSVAELVEAGSLEVILPGCDLFLNFQITNFQVSAFGTEARQDSGQIFTIKQIELIKRGKPGDKFYFEDIKCLGIDGISRNLGTLLVKIK